MANADAAQAVEQDAPNTGPKTIREIASRKDQFFVPFSEIEIRDGWNARDYAAEDVQQHIQWLKSQFFGGPGVRDAWRGYFDAETGKFVNTDAHCRYLAVQKGIEDGATTGDFKIPVVLEEKGATEADYLATMLLSNSGLPLKAIEKAFVFRRLSDAGKTDEEIGKLANLTRQQAANIKMLAYATPAVVELIKSGEVKPTTVQQEIRSATGETLEEKGAAAEKSILDLVQTAKGLGVKATGDAAEQIRTHNKKAAKATEKSSEKQAGKDFSSGQGNLEDAAASNDKPQIQKFSKVEREAALVVYSTMRDNLPEAEVVKEGSGKKAIAVIKMPWDTWKKIENSMP